jgi:hypothetical protein
MSDPRYSDDDLGHPELDTRDIEILRALYGRRLLYVSEGRLREAHGVGAAMDLVWRGMTQRDARLEAPFETRPMELDDLNPKGTRT